MRAMLAYTWSFLSILLTATALQAQTNKIDSLKQVLLTSKEDTGKVNILNLLSRQVFLKGNYDTALYYARQAKTLAEQKNFGKGVGVALNNMGNVQLMKGDKEQALEFFKEALAVQSKLTPDAVIKKGIAASYSNIGAVHASMGDLEQALKNYKAALDLRTEINDQQGLAISYTNIALIHYNKGNYPEALKNNFVALKIEQEMDDKLAIARSYNNIGSIYVQQANYPEAIRNFSSALEIQKELGDKQGIGRSYNNLGTIQYLEKNYTKALQSFQESLKIKETIGDRFGIGHSLINIGNVQHTLSLPENVKEQEREALQQQAMDNFNQALAILREIGDKQGMAMCYNNMGTVYIARHKATEAANAFNKGLELASAAGSKDDMKSSYAGLAAADSAAGRWQEAFTHYKLYMLYRDSLTNEENTKKIVQAQMNYEFEQKEMQAKTEQEKKELIYGENLKRQRIIGWSSAGILSFTLLSSMLWFNRSRLKQKHLFQQKLNQQQKEQAEAIIELQEQERKRIAEDLHDSLGHLLSTAKLNLQSLPPGQKEKYFGTLQLLDQASTQIREISFNLMPQALEEEGLVPALYELADKIRRSKLYEIMVQVHNMEDFQLDKQTCFNIYRIVQEAVNNILKHADAKEIGIQLVKQDDHLSIMIEDDGKGFDINQVKRRGRGLKNITARSEWLHGSISIDSTPGRGTTIAIEIPLGRTYEDKRSYR